MENINLKSIRWESIKSVFLAIAHTDKVSRADISAETDLSLMTVGKVADALLDIGIIEQSKETRASAGRRAGLLSINLDNFAVIYDLSCRNFCCCIMDMQLNPVQTIPYSYIDSLSFPENLERFLQNASSYLHGNTDMQHCVGVGVSVPGPYFPDSDRTLCPKQPYLETVNIASTIRRYLPDSPLFIEAGYNAAAASNIASIPNYKDKTILYWCISDESIHGAVVHHNELLRGAHHLAGNFGNMIVSPAKILSAAVKPTNQLEDNALELARAIHNVICILDPDTIILECTMYENGADFADLVRQILQNKFGFTDDSLPQITVASENTPHAYRGLTMHLRESWLHDRVFRDKE